MSVFSSLETEMTKENELGTAPIGRTLFHLALPTVAAQVINMLYNVVDRVYIGHMEGVGSLALTGVGVCLPLIMFISAFACFVSAGSASRASMFMGKGEKEKAEKILGGSFTLQIVISVVLTVVLELTQDPLLLAFGASSNTIGYASSYMRIYALGTVFVELTLGLNAFITAQGRTVVSMLVVLTGAVLNIVLDPLFIYTFGMGVEGAAWATVISQAASSLFCILYLTGKKTSLRLRGGNLTVPFSLLAPSFALGAASFVMQSTESLISVCFNSSLLKYGGDAAVGAMTICSSVLQMAMLPIQGIAQGSQPLTSYNFGQGNRDRVKKCFRTLLIACSVYSVTVWALVELFPSAFASIFTTESALVEYAVPVLRTYCLMLCLMGILISCQMTFVSTGVAAASISIAVIRKLVLLIPLIYIMPHIFTQNQALAVFMAEPIADFLAIAYTAIIFSVKFPKALREMKIV